MARIAVAGATGRVGRHVVDVLRGGGHDVVAISRSNGVDVITGDGLRAAQFHEFVEVLMGWGRQGDVVYLPPMRTQIVAARTVAQALAALALSREPEGARPDEIAGPREEYLPDLAGLGAAQPRVKGSRVPPVSSTQMALVWVYSCTASMPFSRPSPDRPKPPNGTSGPTTR